MVFKGLGIGNSNGILRFNGNRFAPFKDNFTFSIYLVEEKKTVTNYLYYIRRLSQTKHFYVKIISWASLE